METNVSLITLIIWCLLSVCDTQTKCNIFLPFGCSYGTMVVDAKGNCKCKCVMKYTNRYCTSRPYCGGRSCGKYGHLRGDCECFCYYRSYVRDNCQTFRCPYSEDYECGQTNTKRNCSISHTRRHCPYQCKICTESQRPTLGKSKYLHISQYGCVFEGIRPSKEMCKTMGINGDDDTSCFRETDVEKNCRKCKNGDHHAIVKCPVMCGLCDKPGLRLRKCTIRRCIWGNLVFDETGICKCKCVMNYTGETCATPPDCGGKTCGIHGSLRGDCECICPRLYVGDRCQTFRCPYSDNYWCRYGTYHNDCSMQLTRLRCPYKCKICQESQRTKLENSKYVHKSKYGCVFEGIRPSKEMCKTMGYNGNDKTFCNYGCERCDNGGSPFALVHCPVKCGICDEPDNSSTTAGVTLSFISGPNTSITSIMKNLTNVSQRRKTQITTHTLDSGKIAAVVLGLVLGVGIISVIIYVLKIRVAPICKRNISNESSDDVTANNEANIEGANLNEHYVSVVQVEDKKSSKYEMVYIENSPNESNNREQKMTTLPQYLRN